ncbi:hypothetical protein QR98_0067900 [Sarcoptes scabiei]|uniref:Uncharacterized protein n=1 Tax=Sarcoptes scabiei TaxID=52283 RepID=A0A132ABB6_SARSC|nr:hypothetical protein QR98_0067900 [Sarcoptes scabiei]
MFGSVHTKSWFSYFIVFCAINILLNDLMPVEAGIKKRMLRKVLKNKNKIKWMMKLARKKKIVPLPLPVPVPLLPLALLGLKKKDLNDSEFYMVKDGEMPPKKIVKKYVDHHGSSQILWDSDEEFSK